MARCRGWLLLEGMNVVCGDWTIVYFSVICAVVYVLYVWMTEVVR